MSFSDSGAWLHGKGPAPAFIKGTVTIQFRAVAYTTVDQVQALGFYGVHRGQRILYLFGSSIVGCIAAILIFWQQERKKFASLDGARHRCIAEVNAFLKPFSLLFFRNGVGLYGPAVCHVGHIDPARGALDITAAANGKGHCYYNQ